MLLPWPSPKWGLNSSHLCHHAASKGKEKQNKGRYSWLDKQLGYFSLQAQTVEGYYGLSVTWYWKTHFREDTQRHVIRSKACFVWCIYSALNWKGRVKLIWSLSLWILILPALILHFIVFLVYFKFYFYLLTMVFCTYSNILIGILNLKQHFKKCFLAGAFKALSSLKCNDWYNFNWQTCIWEIYISYIWWV